MAKKKAKIEFSKKIFYIIITLFIMVIGYSMALMWKTETTDGLSYLIPSITGLTATCVGFYYWKSKMENMIKLSKKNNMTIDKIKELEEQFDDYDVKSESEEC